MHLCPHLLEPLLVADTEVLLFVDHHQPEVLEPYRLGQQRMGADDDIDRSICHRGPRRIRILDADEPRQRPHRDRKAAEPFGKTAEMLAGEQGRGADHRDLQPRQCRNEGRAHRHLGLAETDVADNQPVHR